jgi:hypothetical protein
LSKTLYLRLSGLFQLRGIATLSAVTNGLINSKKAPPMPAQSEKDEFALFGYLSIAEAKRLTYPSENPML